MEIYGNLKLKFSKQNIMFKFVLIFIIIFLISDCSFELYQSKKFENVSCKIIDLQQQQIISGTKSNMNTEIRYLVITDKETFVCETSYFNAKFNNSDIFFRLKKDQTCTFNVCGIGKTIISDYRNILQIKN